MRQSAFATILLCCFGQNVAAASPIAAVICDTKDVLSQKLERQMGAAQLATGLRGPEEVMELWGTEAGDWTLVMTYASGKSCIVAMGEHLSPSQLTLPSKDPA